MRTTKQKAIWLVTQHPKILAYNPRVEKAIKIVDTQRVHRLIGQKFEVEGDHGINYIVDHEEKSCTCPDSEKGNVCKHRIAVHLVTMDGG